MASWASELGVGQVAASFAEQGAETLDDLCLMDADCFAEVRKVAEGAKLKKLQQKKLLKHLERLEEMVTQFQRLDTDESGELDREEIRALCESAGVTTEEGLDTFTFTSDGENSVVSFSEFARW